MQLFELKEKLKLSFSCASPQSGGSSTSVDYFAINKNAHNLDPIPTLILTELWNDDKSRVKNGMKKLANLCFGDDGREANRKAIYEAGGHATIVGAMMKWIGCPIITAEGCRTLQNATADNPVYRDSAVKVGALEIVLAAMRKYFNDRYLQRVGCGALHSLTKNNLSHSVRMVTELGGVQTIVDGMKSFPDSIRLQMWACIAINNLSQWETQKERIVDAGALAVLVNALETSNDMTGSEVVSIRENALSAKKRLLS